MINMTTYSQSYQSPNKLIFIILLAVLIVGALAVAVSTDTSHAFVRHGTDADYARECKGNPESTLFINPDNGRQMFVCLTSIGQYGMWISEKDGQEVTAFLKNKFKNWEQVLKYVQNSGYK